MIAIDAIVFLLLATLTIVISVVGGRSAESFRYRTAIHIMGFVSILCVIFIAFQNYQKQTESAQVQQKSQETLAEITRIQNLNTELQKQLINSTAVVAGLAKQNIDEVTGGDSFCYVEIRQNGTTGALTAVVLGKGKNPVSDVEIRITDLDVFDKIMQTAWTEESMRKSHVIYPFPLPTRYSGLSRTLHSFYPLPGEISKRYNIFIRARNGYFTELLRLRLVDKTWRVAVRVTASYYDKRTGIVLEEIDRGFPKDELQGDKDWLATEKLKRLKIDE